MKKTKETKLTQIFLVFILLMVMGCGGDTASSENSNNIGSNQKSTVSGTLLDEDGEPIVGALVVAGENSPTDITNENGDFEITNVPAGAQALNVITEGHYTLEENEMNITGDINVGKIKSKIIDEHYRSPKFSSVSVVVASGKVNFTAEIIKGEEGSDIKDVRAELPGYNTGIALTLSGSNTYEGSIDLPENAGGPKLSVLFFGIDEDRRVGTSYAMSNEFAGNGGEYLLSSIDGTWSGSLKFHKRDRDERGEQRGNCKFEIVDGNVKAVYSSPSFRRLKSDSADAPFEDITYENGTAELIDQFLGTYLIHLEDENNTIELLANKREGGLIGFMKIKDKNADSTNKTSRGRFHLISNDDLPRSVEDLNGHWNSSISLITTTETDTNNSWSPYYQLNLQTKISNSSTGTTTLGHQLTNLTITLLDDSLGKYKLIYTYDDGSEIVVWALLGFKSKRLFGVHEVKHAGKSTCGFYWSRLGDETDLFDSSNLGGWYKGELILNGSDTTEKRLKRIVFHLDENGSIDKGMLNIFESNLQAGSFSFSDTSSGKLSGSISGSITESDTENFSINFSLDDLRSSSMGIMKSRIIGEFSGALNNVEISGTMRVHKIHRATRPILDRIRDNIKN